MAVAGVAELLPDEDDDAGHHHEYHKHQQKPNHWDWTEFRGHSIYWREENRRFGQVERDVVAMQKGRSDLDLWLRTEFQEERGNFVFGVVLISNVVQTDVEHNVLIKVEAEEG